MRSIGMILGGFEGVEGHWEGWRLGLRGGTFVCLMFWVRDGLRVERLGRCFVYMPFDIGWW